MALNNYKHTTDIHNTNAAAEIIPFLFKYLDHSKILDVGCGLGTWLFVAKKQGAQEIKGIDGNIIDPELMQIEEKYFQFADLTNVIAFDKKYDITFCLEVAEHLPENYSEILVETLCNSSDVILFSAAIPNQGGQNHINEQHTNYWNKIFKKKGYYAYDILRNMFWNNESIDWWYRQNILIYSKIELPNIFGKPLSNLNTIIHPELLDLKDNEIKRLREIIRDYIDQPKLYKSLKLVFKSIIKF